MYLSIREEGSEEEIGILTSVEIKDFTTPETKLIDKEFTKTMSEEVTNLLELIVNLPSEFIKVDNTPNWGKVTVLCKEKLGWGRKKFENIRFELWFSCKMATVFK